MVISYKILGFTPIYEYRAVASLTKVLWQYFCGSGSFMCLIHSPLLFFYAPLFYGLMLLQLLRKEISDPMIACHCPHLPKSNVVGGVHAENSAYNGVSTVTHCFSRAKNSAWNKEGVENSYTKIELELSKTFLEFW